MKYNLLMSYCTFLAFYLLMKVEGKNVENHPVIFKLAHIKTLFEKLKPLDQKLQYQIDKMIRLSEAQETVAASKSNLRFKPNLKDLKEADDSEEEEGLSDEDMSGEEGSESELEDDMNGKRQAVSSGDEESEDVVAKPGIYKAPKITASTFEDRKDKKIRQKDEYERKKIGKSSLIEELRKEMRDEPEEVYMGAGKKTKTSKYEDMLEEQEMENFRRVQMSKKEKKALRNKRLEGMEDRLEDLDDDFKAIQSIVKRAGAIKGKSGNDEYESAQRDVAGSKFSKSLKKMSDQQKKTKFSDLKSAKIKGDEVYEKEHERRREKKAQRKEVEKEIKGRVAGEVKDMEQSIQRNINYNIEKAKGITRKRKKEDANPRVKKRHKYEKMVKAHKKRVQEFDSKKAGQLYKGEETGITSGLKRSTKMY